MTDEKPTIENKERAVISAKDVETAEDGKLIVKNLDTEIRLAGLMIKSGMLPAQYKTPEMVITAKQFAIELGLKPLTALRQMTVIKGNPTIYGDLPLALVKNSHKLEWIKEFLLDKDGHEISMGNNNLDIEPFAAVCRVKRKGEEAVKETYYNMDLAEKAHLTNKDCWKFYKKTMLKYRARGEALHDCFPDVLNGISISEYDYNEIPVNNKGVDIATTDEVKEHLDIVLSDYKIELITSISGAIKQLKTMDKKFNDARIVQLFNEYLNTESITQATEQNLERLKDHLGNRIQVLSAGKNG